MTNILISHSSEQRPIVPPSFSIISLLYKLATAVAVNQRGMDHSLRTFVDEHRKSNEEED
jgi:hypothetical protein